MNIPDILAKIAPKASPFASSIEAVCVKFAINTPLRVAHFLAQLAHESGGFRYVREIWGPTPAQSRYEGRRDLGNVQPGDGHKFMGRGFIQITGRANYEAASRALYGDLRLLEHPELLERNPAASAGWYWDVHHLNALADRDDLQAVTRAINGGLNGLADRQDWLNKFRKETGA